MSPLFVGSARAVVAAAIAALCLLLIRPLAPRGRQWVGLFAVSGGVVIGFPVLTSYAIEAVPASHGAVVIAVLPAATAMVTVARTREKVPGRFWVWSLLGACCAVGFALLQGGGFGGLHRADALLLGAVAAAAVGYTEGGVLAREIGSWQMVCWSLVVTTPVTVVLTIASIALDGLPSATPSGWLAFTYLGAVSALLAFFAWYRGLAIGPMVQVSQIQLVQPLLSLSWAALLLGEALGWQVLLGGGVIVVCAAQAVRTRQRAARRGSARVLVSAGSAEQDSSDRVKT